MSGHSPMEDPTMDTIVTQPQRNKKTRGSALLMAMFCIALVSLAVAGMSQMVNGQVQMNKMMVNNAKAREVANGALEQALAMMSIMQLDDEASELPSELESGTIGDGTYTVELYEMDYGLYEVKAKGTVGPVTEQIKVYIRKPNAGQAFKKGMFSNSNIDISGSGTARAGTHSNGNQRVWGSVDMWTGDADAAGTMEVGGSANLHGGTANANKPRITMPQLNWDYYYQIAVANGQVRNGNQTLDGVLTIPGGIMWVNGDVTLKGKKGSVITGSIFATGSINQESNLTITSANLTKNPVLASRDGSLNLKGNGNGGGIFGFVYLKTGYVDWTGNCNLKGAIIANGDIWARGNWGDLDPIEVNPEILEDPRIHLLAYEE